MTGACCPGLRRTCSRRASHLLASLALLFILVAGPTRAHDPGAWGGVFRSRDQGATWASANRGAFSDGTIALAISPTDPSHLLLGTEAGLLRSRNGGRDWTIEDPARVPGAVFALSFAMDGRRALASTRSSILRGEADNAWSEAAAPRGATPARVILRGAEEGRVYLAGWTGLYRSDDWGLSWSSAAAGLPREPVTALAIAQGAPETLYAVVQGGVWASGDGGRNWASREGGIPPAGVSTLAVEPRHPARLWAAGRDGLFRSDDRGETWQRFGRPLPESDTAVNGMAVGPEAIVVATDRGLYRSADGGESWVLLAEGLPAHLEAGPLLQDPGDPATLYAGFSLTPYRELWRRAANDEGALAQVGAAGFAGGAAVLLVVAFGAAAALRRLGRFYPSSAGRISPVRSVTGHRIEEETPL